LLRTVSGKIPYIANSLQCTYMYSNYVLYTKDIANAPGESRLVPDG